MRAWMLAGAPCPDTQLQPTAENLPAVDAAALCLVNQVRIAHGLPALADNPALALAAQNHDDDMVASDYFDHVGPAGDTPRSRVQASGYIGAAQPSWVVGENIAWGTLTLATPAAIVTGWVNSPEHLANILDPAFRDTALRADAAAPASLSMGEAGAVYTEDFGAR